MSEERASPQGARPLLKQTRIIVVAIFSEVKDDRTPTALRHYYYVERRTTFQAAL
jgi:hypothetical protein